VVVNSAPNGDKIIVHGGESKASNQIVSYIPTGKLAVIVLANLEGRAANDIAADLRKVAHHEAVTLISDRMAVAVSSDMLERVTAPTNSRMAKS